VFPEKFSERHHKEKSHPHSGQVSRARTTVLPFRVNNGNGRRQRGRGLMVVGDNDINVFKVGLFNGLVAADTAVNRNDQVNILF